MNLGQARSPKPTIDVKPGRALRALAELLRRDDLDAFAFFDATLELLIRQFMVNHALITRLSKGQLDSFWWAHAGSGAEEPVELNQSLRLCRRVLKEPTGSLALGEVSRAEGGPWLRAFAGVVLREGGRPIGTLAVLHSHPFVWHAEDLDFIRSVAGLLGRALEIENLKYQLQVAQETLALSSAVVQDSALESAETGLPNGRFLEVWIKGNLNRARRRKETLSLALLGGASPGREQLQTLARSLRGDDLLVELSTDRYLLLLPQTQQEGAQVLLERIAHDLGQPPVGATLWQPDQDDLMLHAAMRRAEQALQDALTGGGGIHWKLATLVALG